MMVESGVQALPVVENGKIVGNVSMSDGENSDLEIWFWIWIRALGFGDRSEELLPYTFWSLIESLDPSTPVALNGRGKPDQFIRNFRCDLSARPSGENAKLFGMPRHDVAKECRTWTTRIILAPKGR